MSKRSYPLPPTALSAFCLWLFCWFLHSIQLFLTWVSLVPCQLIQQSPPLYDNHKLEQCVSMTANTPAALVSDFSSLCHGPQGCARIVLNHILAGQLGISGGRSCHVQTPGISWLQCPCQNGIKATFLLFVLSEKHNREKRLLFFNGSIST